MTNEEYRRYAGKHAPRSRVGRNCLGAFLVGGSICCLGQLGGAGTLVPITGFANSVAAPALEFKTEGLITGTAARMFVIAGPVIVFGIGSSVVYGLILCLAGGGA